MREPPPFSATLIDEQCYIIRIPAPLSTLSIHIPVFLMSRRASCDGDVFLFSDRNGVRYEGFYSCVLCDWFPIPENLIDITRQMHEVPFEQVRWDGQMQNDPNKEFQTNFTMGEFPIYKNFLTEANRRCSLPRPIVYDRTKTQWMDPKLLSYAISRWYNFRCAEFCEKYITSRSIATANSNPRDRKVDFTIHWGDDDYEYDCKGSVWPKFLDNRDIVPVVKNPIPLLTKLYLGASKGVREINGNRFYLIFRDDAQEYDLLLKRDPYLIAFFIDHFFNTLTSSDFLKVPIPIEKIVIDPETKVETKTYSTTKDVDMCVILIRQFATSIARRI